MGEGTVSGEEISWEPRVAIPDPGSAAPELRAAFKKIEGDLGLLPDLFKSMAHHPGAVEPLYEAFKAIYVRSEIEERLQQIALIRAAVENESDYCLHMHMDFGLRAGLTHKQIDALRYAPAGGEFTDKEQAVIAYADKVTRGAAHIPDELFARLRSHFSEGQIVNLTLIVAMSSLFSHYSSALKLHPGH